MEEMINVIHNNNKNGTTLTLDGELTIYSVTAAHKTLSELFDAFVSPVSLDVSRVSEIDTAGVQLLLFVKKQLGECDKAIYISNSNSQLDSIFSLLDLTNLFAVEM